MAYRQEIRFCGYGGQGIILAGFITGQAASIYAKRAAVFTQDYGPEARGGACRADVIIADELVLYPYIDAPSILVAMSQEAFGKFSPRIRKDTVVIIDSDLVKPDRPLPRPPLLMTARHIATGLGRVGVANVVMLGFLTAATKILPPDAVKESILASVPKNTGTLNLKAFDEGYTAGLKAGASK